MDKVNVKIFYKKSIMNRSTEVNMDDYALVYERELDRITGYSDNQILEAHFELFNWIHEGFQPNDPAIGFNRNGADHTSMSVNDIVQINDVKYLCDSFGWQKVG